MTYQTTWSSSLKGDIILKVKEKFIVVLGTLIYVYII